VGGTADKSTHLVLGGLLAGAVGVRARLGLGGALLGVRLLEDKISNQGHAIHGDQRLTIIDV
jgi:hypothetical protein